MYVKPYKPGGNEEKQKPFREKLKALIAKKATRIFLFALSGALLLAAVLIFVIQWNEGETAQNKAEQLLAEVSFGPSDAEPFTTGAYEQPEQPDAQGEEEIKGILETELKGYAVIARLDIDKIDVHLPVLSETSTKALKVSLCYYSGPEPGKDGNLVITGHNYRSGAHFGKLDKVKEGDAIKLTDIEGNVYEYTVYKTEIITPDDVKALDKTEHANELTLLTCEANANRRLLVRCCLKGE
jgi:LPXTG-site transpeptidase (sortase) family protein